MSLAADPVLPEWMARYDGDVLTPELRRKLAVWRAAVGVPDNQRTMAGPVPRDDREASYHRHLTQRIGAKYGEAVRVWADRIVEYVGKPEEQTAELAKYLDQLSRKGVDAERLLGLAAACKPLAVTTPHRLSPTESRTLPHRRSCGLRRASTRSSARPSVASAEALGCEPHDS